MLEDSSRSANSDKFLDLHSKLTFISSENPELIFNNLHLFTINESSNCHLVDLTFEQFSENLTHPPFVIKRFHEYTYIVDILEKISPHIKDWIDFLDLNHLHPTLYPDIPGLDRLCRCLYIAESIYLAHKNNYQLVFILPAPTFSLRLFDDLIQAPELLNLIFNPLLAWWDETCKNLKGLNTFLRLNLPSSSNISLSKKWKKIIVHTASMLKSYENYKFICGLNTEHCTTSDFNLKLLNTSFHSPMIYSYLFYGSNSFEIGTHFTKYSPYVTLLPLANSSYLHSVGIIFPNNILLKEVSSDGTTKSIQIFVPGYVGTKPQIIQHKNKVYLLHKGHRKCIYLSDYGIFEDVNCSGAKLTDGTLTIEFCS